MQPPNHQTWSYFILIPLPPTDLIFYKHHQNYTLLLDSLRESLTLSDHEPTIVCGDGPVSPGTVPVRVDHPDLLDLADEQVRRGLLSRGISIVLSWLEGLGFEGDGEVPGVLGGFVGGCAGGGQLRQGVANDIRDERQIRGCIDLRNNDGGGQVWRLWLYR